MRCSHCGEQGEHVANFCPECGTPVAGKWDAPTTDTPPAGVGDGTEADTKCPVCTEPIEQIGPYCHHCGARTNLRGKKILPREQAVAFSPWQDDAYPLAGTYAYCPISGKRIHLVCEINPLALYMQGVATKTDFRFERVGEGPVVIERVEVAVGGVALKRRMLKNTFPVKLDWDTPARVLPAMVRPDRDTDGEPLSGDVWLSVSVVYTVPGRRIHLSGAIEISVLPKDCDVRREINIAFDGRVHQSGEGPQSAGVHKNEVHLSGLEQQEESQAAFIKRVNRERGVAFQPFGLHKVEEEILNPAPEAADCAKLFSMCDGIPHQWCLLSKVDIWAGYGDAVQRFGHPDLVLRAFEREARHQRERNTDPIKLVSTRQWRMNAGDDAISVHVLSESNLTRSGGNFYRAGDHFKLDVGESMEIAWEEHPEEEILGLRHVARSSPDTRIDAWRHFAELELRELGAEHKLEAPATNRGAHTLKRLHSFTGERMGYTDEVPRMEAYVIGVGCASIGSAPGTNIRVKQPGVAPHHAWLFYLHGYFFIVSESKETHVWLKDEPVTCMSPRLLRPNDIINIGRMKLRFVPFGQFDVR